MDDRTDDRWDDQPDDADGEPDGMGPDGNPDGVVVGDADLVAQVRQGHDEPYAELYRRHQPAALALARTLTQHAAADDVVSEAFEKLLLRIRDGGGPEAAFRPYLLRTVRTVAVDASRRTRRLVVAEDPAEAATTAPTQDAELVDAVHERTTLARAFVALPERWQTFLWLSVVDDADRREIATILGINVGSVSALGYRAREGLRRAYLDAHLRDAPTPQCREVWPLLAGATRGGLGSAQQELVDEHLAGCDHCRAALAELEAVNTRLGAVLAPIVLGAAAPAYLAAVREGSTAAAAAAAAAGATPAAAPVAEAGSGATPAPIGLKAGVAGFGKTSAASVAVLACVSTVAVVAILAALTAPLGYEPSVAPRPGTTSGEGSGDSTADGSDSTGESSPDSSSGVDDATSSSASDPASSGAPTDPTSTTGPTGQPTGSPTGGPTGGPTGDPTVGPTDGPTGNPATAPPTTPGNPPTSGPTASGSPTPQLVQVDAGVGQIAVEARSRTSAPAHLDIPVFLQGGSAELQLTLSVRGLNKFTVTHGTGDGSWSCLATTPMAGANKTAVLRCSLEDAHPADALRLGINLGYSGDGLVTAVLAVLGNVVDSSSSDNTVTTKLPTKRAE